MIDDNKKVHSVDAEALLEAFKIRESVVRNAKKSQMTKDQVIRMRDETLSAYRDFNKVKKSIQLMNEIVELFK